MARTIHEIISNDYENTAEIPRGQDIHYLCGVCGDIIPSASLKNIGCKCGNIFIDHDYLRLVVDDLTKMSTVRNSKKKPRTSNKPMPKNGGGPEIG